MGVVGYFTGTVHALNISQLLESVTKCMSSILYAPLRMENHRAIRSSLDHGVNAKREKPTRWLSVHWPTNGYASSDAAGRIASRTMKPGICWHSKHRVLHLLKSWRASQFFLDGLPQGLC